DRAVAVLVVWIGIAFAHGARLHVRHRLFGVSRFVIRIDRVEGNPPRAVSLRDLNESRLERLGVWTLIACEKNDGQLAVTGLERVRLAVDGVYEVEGWRLRARRELVADARKCEQRQHESE